jgi:hypothetical protein
MDIRDELDIAKSWHDRRPELVAEARRQGLTWVEIGSRLGVTPHGLIKAQKKWNEEQPTTPGNSAESSA